MDVKITELLDKQEIRRLISNYNLTLESTDEYTITSTSLEYVYKDIPVSYFAKAEDETGNFLGWVCVWGDHPALLESHFYVHPEHRRKGIGTKLVQALESRYFDSSVIAWNSVAEEFFQKSNFTNILYS